jgi:hypothetical protein
MDYEKLRKRLRGAEVILGDVKDTVDGFFQTCKPAPVAAVMFDMDLYSSTAPALRWNIVYYHYRIWSGVCDKSQAIFYTIASFFSFSKKHRYTETIRLFGVLIDLRTNLHDANAATGC